MYRCLGVVGLFALAAQGCGPASAPKPVPLSSFRVEYRSWSCEQLAEEADMLNDSLMVAAEQGSSDRERVVHIERAMNAARKESASKGCKPGVQ